MEVPIETIRPIDPETPDIAARRKRTLERLLAESPWVGFDLRIEKALEKALNSNFDRKVIHSLENIGGHSFIASLWRG